MSRKEAEKILYDDPKNPFKLAIKHVLVKSDVGSAFYYYMRLLSLMHGHFVRICLGIITAIVALGFAIYQLCQNPNFVRFVQELAANAASAFSFIAQNALLLLANALLIILAYGVAGLLAIAILLVLSCIVDTIITVIYKVVVNIIAALFF